MNVGERFAWVRAVIAAQPRPTLAQVAVAVTLAEHFNEGRGAAWPSSRSMSDGLRLDRSNVRRALRSLEERGFLERIAGRFRSTAWLLVMPEAGAVQPPQRGSYDPLNGGSTAPLKGVVQPPEQVFRSEAVGRPYSAASARSPYGSRASGGGKAQNLRKAGPAIPLKL